MEIENSLFDSGCSLSTTPESSRRQMSAEEKYAIVRGIGEECIKEDELNILMEKNPQPICYDGFEPSGRMHIAQGLMKTISINKLTSAGGKVKIWIADWFAQMNNKMGGDLEKIKVIGEYMIEILKAVGMNQDSGQVEFLWSSQEIFARAHEYWPLVMEIGGMNMLDAISGYYQIASSSEQDELTGAHIFHPCMQCSNIFFLEADICYLGMDEQKIAEISRDYCNKVKRRNKPIMLLHHMLLGLQEGQGKMSKSDPSSAIFMDDGEADINIKIKKAYCPPNVVNGNPCLEYTKHIIFPWFNEFKVERTPQNGGDKTYKSFEELVSDYECGKLNPADLKPSLSMALNRILQPVRDHFKDDPKAKMLLEKVKRFKVTK